MQPSEIFEYYSRPEVQRAIISLAQDREVVGRFADGGYMKRPDILQYPADILERVRQGAVSFHCSVEKWHQPLQLNSELSKKNIDEIRKGWDLIIDIDAKVKLEHARAAAVAVCDFLKDLDITPTVKFSGRRGFHIGVAGNAFPPSLDFQETGKRYPEIPQAIGTFIKEAVKEKIFEYLVAEEGGVAALTRTVESVSSLDPYIFVDIENNWGGRHLFRMPYSLHEKTWLVSAPVRLFKLKDFDMESAKPENVNEGVFLKNKDMEGVELIMRALDWSSRLKPEKIETVQRKKVGEINAVIPEEYFPPCAKNILAGLSDGKQRSVFSLAAFLRASNWEWEKIEARILEWNKSNPRPLSERMIRTQLKWHQRQRRDVLPANCFNEQFYMSIGVCKPDKVCSGLKNPVNYGFKRWLIERRKEKNNTRNGK